MPIDAQLNEVFADLAEVLVSDFDLADLLHRLAGASVRVSDAVGAGIVVVDQQGRLRDVAYSSEDVRRLERFQLEYEEGPCVACHAGGQSVHEPDLAAAAVRWPRFVPRATAMGVRSADALPLRMQGRTVGALNLFHAEVGPTPPAKLRAVQALADLAMLGIVQHGSGTTSVRSVQASVRDALSDRSMIERAKGMLAEHGQLTMDEAFLRLLRYAELNATGLTQTAAELSRTPGHAATVLAATAG
ncbi:MULTISPECIES: GAF and ANTAR domain-containing protein [Streptacidiphilus]|uniref:GAF and ANTAR domain-containing protein n=1 Tax=Streptacidiphilus cavernicola TaxID=3342716 RepID=A0ABV6UKV5_9ACTN|nr:GAF and ANTAR domain-containing protein [Streptacidiphilus jeojiense]